MFLARKVPFLPDQLARINMSTKRLHKGCRWMLPKLRWLESWIKPRWLLLSSQYAKPFIGFVVLMLAIIVAVPFPFSNLLPAVAMLFIAIGLLERDGLFVAIGLGVSLIAVALSFTVVKIIYFWFESFFLV